MNEDHHRLLEQALALHAGKARPTEEPRAHLLFASDKNLLDPHAAWILLSREHVLSTLDTTSPLVQRLLEQMRTYDCRKQRIVGCVFDRRTVLSEVLRCPPGMSV